MSDLYNLNARIRAPWGRLLTRSDYEKLLASPGLPEIAASLRETPYGFFIESVGRGISDAGRMEEALRRNFQETLSRLLSVSGGDCREAVRLLLGSWEVQAVKTVLRGKAAGIPPEEIPHAFERFRLRARAGHGSPDGAGLGLAIVRELTEAMGGSVAVENLPGRGARFTIRLPTIA